MANTTHVFALTDKEFNLNTLPIGNMAVHKLKGHPDTMSQQLVRLRTTQMLDSLLNTPDFGLQTPVYIVVEPTALSFVALEVLLYAFWQIAMFPHIWMINEGKDDMYIGPMFALGEANDWVTRFNKYWRRKLEISNLEK